MAEEDHLDDIEEIKSSLDNEDKKYGMIGTEEEYGCTINNNFIMRYLRARNFNLDKTEQSIRETLDWRKGFGPHLLHINHLETIRLENETGKIYLRGYDKLGHIIMYMKPRFENTHTHESNIMHLVYMMERAIVCLDRHNMQEKILLITDYKDFSKTKRTAFKTSKEILHIMQNHYVERLYKAFLCDAPWVFWAFWSLISPFIDHRTKEKIIFLRGNIDHKREILTDYIDVDQFEDFIGGNLRQNFDSTTFLNGEMNQEFQEIYDQLHNENNNDNNENEKIDDQN